jgi:phage shock protein A
MIANSEIEELKDGLNYAEYMLAKTMQEKEKFEDQGRNKQYQIEELNS